MGCIGEYLGVLIKIVIDLNGGGILLLQDVAAGHRLQALVYARIRIHEGLKLVAFGLLPEPKLFTTPKAKTLDNLASRH